MGHGRAAFLSLGEAFFDLQNIGALQVANLCGEAIERGANQGEDLHVIGMAIAGDHLGARRVGSEAKNLAGEFFHLWICIGVGAHRSAHLAYGYITL